MMFATHTYDEAYSMVPWEITTEVAELLGGVDFWKKTPLTFRQMHDAKVELHSIVSLFSRTEKVSQQTKIRFACDCAERTLPIFEGFYPKDTRLRDAINVSRRAAEGNAPLDELIETIKIVEEIKQNAWVSNEKAIHYLECVKRNESQLNSIILCENYPIIDDPKLKYATHNYAKIYAKNLDKIIKSASQSISKASALIKKEAKKLGVIECQYDALYFATLSVSNCTRSTWDDHVKMRNFYHDAAISANIAISKLSIATAIINNVHPIPYLDTTEVEWQVNRIIDLTSCSDTLECA